MNLVNPVTIQVDPSVVGKCFAHASSQEQAAIFNFMGYELKIYCRTATLLENQICFLSDLLDANGKHLIRELAEFIRLREENAPGKREA